MMDFLRQLAPVREPAAGVAVAVVPSRFAIERPMRAMPPAVKDDEGRPNSPEPSPAHHLPASFDAAPTHAAITAGTVPSPSAAGAVTPRRSVEKRDLPEASPSIIRERPTEPARPLETRQPARAQREHAPTAAHAPDRRVEFVPHRASSAVADDPVRSARTAQAFAVASPTGMPPSSAPISHAALAIHARPLADPRPVIHVTIDRIDVRAPAAPRDTAAPRKSRAAAPSVSLSDYLRSGRSGKAGGAS